MGAVLRALKENPVETTTVVVGIALGLILGIATILGYSSTELAIGISLEILAIIAIVLFIIRGKTYQVEQNTHETAAKLQGLEGCLEDIRLHCWRLSEIFDSFIEKKPEIKRNLKAADQVWILSRTCRRLGLDFTDELEPLAQRDKLRLLLLDPKGHALGLTAQSTKWDSQQDRNHMRTNVVQFLKYLEDFSQENGLGQFVRTIDYLPAWTLILVNPIAEGSTAGGGKIYVEMATYRADSRERPCFTVLSDNDYSLFSEFCEEYSRMWQEADPAWKQPAKGISIPQP